MIEMISIIKHLFCNQVCNYYFWLAQQLTSDLHIKALNLMLKSGIRLFVGSSKMSDTFPSVMSLSG